MICKVQLCEWIWLQMDELEKLVDVNFSFDFVQKDDFISSYYRNNRACGQKNIQCFPMCSELKHVDRGFCGRPLTVVVNMTEASTSQNKFFVDDIRFVAEFRVVGSNQTITSLLSNDSLKSIVKTKSNPTNSYFMGKVIETNTTNNALGSRNHQVVVNFNSECKGWHYGWVGLNTKHTVSHVVTVTILRVDRELSFGRNGASPLSTAQLIELHGAHSVVLRPVAHFDSPSFTVGSLRRKANKTSSSTSLSEMHQDVSGAESTGSTLHCPSQDSADTPSPHQRMKKIRTGSSDSFSSNSSSVYSTGTSSGKHKEQWNKERAGYSEIDTGVVASSDTGVVTESKQGYFTDSTCPIDLLARVAEHVANATK